MYICVCVCVYLFEDCESMRMRRLGDVTKISADSVRKRERERERDEGKRKVKKLAKRAWKIWHSSRSSYPSIYLQYFPTSTFRNASCSRTNYAPYCLSFKERRRRNCRRPVSALISEGEETSFQGRRER